MPNTSPAWVTQTPLLARTLRTNWNNNSCCLASRYHLHRSYVTSTSRSHCTTMCDETPASTEQKAIITGTLDHVAFSCRLPPLDVARWYERVLGLEAVDFEAYESGRRPFPSVRVNALTIIDFMHSPSTDPANGLAEHSHMCLCFTKDVFDHLIDRLKKHGVQYSHPPKLLSGAKGKGWAVYLKDIDGNNVELRYYD